jgi:hypothetical protein
MNRKQRRARPIARVRFGRNAIQGDPVAAAQCPDCDSEVILLSTTVGGRHHVIEVHHDETCPWYAELKRDLAP